MPFGIALARSSVPSSRSTSQLRARLISPPNAMFMPSRRSAGCGRRARSWCPARCVAHEDMTTSRITRREEVGPQVRCALVKVCLSSIRPRATPVAQGLAGRSSSRRPSSRHCPGGASAPWRGLELPHQRHVGLLQAGPAHLQVRDRLAVLGGTDRGRTRSRPGWMHEPLGRPGSSGPRPRWTSAGTARRRSRRR